MAEEHGGEAVPAPMLPLATTHLFDLHLRVSVVRDLGGLAGGGRRLAPIDAGSFAGPRLNGNVLDGGSDLQSAGADGGVTIDARLVLQTSDGAVIGMTYSGVRTGAPDVLAQLARGEPVDPGSYYFRIAGRLTTADPRYQWLNDSLAIGVGHRFPDGPHYSVYRLD